MTLSPGTENATDKAQEITLTFEKGEPVAIDDEKYGAVDLLTKLNFQITVRAVEVVVTIAMIVIEKWTNIISILLCY